MLVAALKRNNKSKGYVHKVRLKQVLVDLMKKIKDRILV